MNVFAKHGEITRFLGDKRRGWRFRTRILAIIDILLTDKEAPAGKRTAWKATADAFINVNTLKWRGHESKEAFFSDKSLFYFEDGFTFRHKMVSARRVTLMGVTESDVKRALQMCDRIFDVRGNNLDWERVFHLMTEKTSGQCDYAAFFKNTPPDSDGSLTYVWDCYIGPDLIWCDESIM